MGRSTRVAWTLLAVVVLAAVHSATATWDHWEHDHERPKPPCGPLLAGRLYLRLEGRQKHAQRGDLTAPPCHYGAALSLSSARHGSAGIWELASAQGLPAGADLTGRSVTLRSIIRQPPLGSCKNTWLATYGTCAAPTASLYPVPTTWVPEAVSCGRWRLRASNLADCRGRPLYLGVKSGDSWSSPAGIGLYSAATAGTSLLEWSVAALPGPVSPPPSPRPPPPSTRPPSPRPPSPRPPSPRPPSPRPPSPRPPSPRPPSPRPPSPRPPSPSPRPPPPSPSPHPPPPSPSPPSPPPPSPSPPPPSPPPPSPAPPPPACEGGEPCQTTADCCDNIDKGGLYYCCTNPDCGADQNTCYPICFPGGATVQVEGAGRLTMEQLRPGHRVLSVGWDGTLRYEEVYMFTRADRAAVGQYSRISALSVNASGQPTTHELRLSPFHYLTSGADPSGACAALAAEASAPAGLGSKDGALLAAWDLAAQHLDFAGHHVMKLPTEVSPGMVAWLADPADPSGRATPACITAVNATVDFGAFSPFVRARGIVVDGVVASPHVRWGYVWGRLWLPAAVNPYVPAVMEALLTPFWLAYKVLGPRRTWRILQHPIFGSWDLGNIIVGNLAVWAQAAAALLAVAVAVARRRRVRRAAGAKCKRE